MPNDDNIFGCLWLGMLLGAVSWAAILYVVVNCGVWSSFMFSLVFDLVTPIRPLEAFCMGVSVGCLFAVVWHWLLFRK